MAKKQKPTGEVITSYKGFDKNLRCRGFQFEVGKTFEHSGEVEACSSGFHACEYPLHVMRYYKAGTSRFAIVEQSGQISRHDEDSKIASSRIEIKAEIDIAGLVKAAIKYTMDRCTPADGANSSEASTVVSATKACEIATASGNYGAATASGNSGAATASGDSGAATASGYYGAATASGNSGAATASGRNGKARGKAGCALFLVFRDEGWRIVHAKAAIVGRDGIKEDVWYSLNSSGEFVEAE